MLTILIPTISIGLCDIIKNLELLPDSVSVFNWHSVQAAMYEIIVIIVNNSIIESSTNIYQNYDLVIIPSNNT